MKELARGNDIQHMGLVIDFIRTSINIIAAKKEPTITPDRSNTFGSNSPNLFPIRKTIRITLIAPAKENNCVARKPAPIDMPP